MYRVGPMPGCTSTARNPAGRVSPPLSGAKARAGVGSAGVAGVTGVVGVVPG